MSIAIEASELMEIFQWISTEEAWNICSKEEFTHLKEELSDVIIYCLPLANQLEIDVAASIENKMKRMALNTQYNKELILVLDLVDNYSEVVRNAKKFHNSIDEEGLIKKLSQFRHWYYIEETDGFAPSKFIGYKDITIEDYIEGTKRGQSYMDGRDTVKQLKEWFQPVDNESFEFYYQRLEDFLSQYDKKPNKMLQLHYKK